MAIRVNFAGASLLQPGAYSDVQVAQSQVASPALGVVALIGEADEGAGFLSESGLSAVTFGPDEFSAIQEKFVSGQLVDAAKLAIAPSNDDQIRGGAQELIVVKTNSSSPAQIAIVQGASTYGTLKAKRPGAPGNNTSYGCSVVASGPDMGKAIITLERLDKGVKEISDPIGGVIALKVKCTDSGSTAATLSITASTISTSLTAASTASPLSIPIAQFRTVGQLADFINSQPGYSATVPASSLTSRPISSLDRVSALNILGVFGEVKRDAQDVRDFFASSSLVDFTPSEFAGLPTTMPRTFLSGGARGASSSATVQKCFDALLKRRVNFVVPLFSRDAAADVTDGLTDAASDYAIASVHSMLSAHCNQASTVKGRKERQGFAGFKGSFDDSVERSAGVGSARVQLCFQDILAVSASTGETLQMQPHMLAALSAGMKAAAAPGLPNTYKQLQISGFSHPDFDPETQGDKAIAASLCYVEKSPNGAFRFKLDNSTYAEDTNAWIYNRPSVLYAADLCAYAIRLNTEGFVGRRNSDVSVQSIQNLLVGVFDNLKSLGLIVGDNNTKGRGYKDLSIKIEGSIVTIDVTLALVEGLEFILSSIKVQRAA